MVIVEKCSYFVFFLLFSYYILLFSVEWLEECNLISFC